MGGNLVADRVRRKGFALAALADRAGLSIRGVAADRLPSLSSSSSSQNEDLDAADGVGDTDRTSSDLRRPLALATGILDVATDRCLASVRTRSGSVWLFFSALGPSCDLRCLRSLCALRGELAVANLLASFSRWCWRWPTPIGGRLFGRRRGCVASAELQQEANRIPS